MYAIIENSGSQRKVTQGDEILIDLIDDGQAAVGSPVTFDKVLVVGPVGGTAKLGKPYVAGASVSAEVVEPVVQDDKLTIWKYRPKKTWSKKQGHRQRYTRVRVTAIAG